MNNRTKSLSFQTWKRQIKHIRAVARKAKQDTEFHPVPFLSQQRRTFFRRLTFIHLIMSIVIFAVPMVLIALFGSLALPKPLPNPHDVSSEPFIAVDWTTFNSGGAPLIGAIVLVVISVLAVTPILETSLKITLLKWRSIK